LQTKTTHTKQKKELRKEILKYQGKRAKQVSFRKNIIANSIIVALIAITPYLFQLYEYVPAVEKWDTAFFTIDKREYKNVQILFWISLNKAIPLLLMVIWFFTCSKWWYHVILIPMFMFGFQLFTAINDKTSILDVVEIYWLIPIMMIIIPFVYFIRIKLMDRLVHGIDLRKINAELEEYERKEKEQEKQKLSADTQNS
jgi:amino acid permease